MLFFTEKREIVFCCSKQSALALKGINLATHFPESDNIWSKRWRKINKHPNCCPLHPLVDIGVRAAFGKLKQAFNCELNQLWNSMFAFFGRLEAQLKSCKSTWRSLNSSEVTAFFHFSFRPIESRNHILHDWFHPSMEKVGKSRSSK